MKIRRDWAAWVVLMEGIVVLLTLAYMGRSRYDVVTGGEGNRIARLFLRDPTWLESFVLLFVLAHVAIGALLFVAWLSAKRR